MSQKGNIQRIDKFATHFRTYTLLDMVTQKKLSKPQSCTTFQAQHVL